MVTVSNSMDERLNENGIIKQQAQAERSTPPVSEVVHAADSVEQLLPAATTSESNHQSEKKLTGSATKNIFSHIRGSEVATDSQRNSALNASAISELPVISINAPNTMHEKQKKEVKKLNAASSSNPVKTSQQTQ